MGDGLLPIHEEILRILKQRGASYATPVPSYELASVLRVAPSYVRERVALLLVMKVVGVRRGRGGGYYLRPQAQGSRRSASGRSGSSRRDHRRVRSASRGGRL